MTTPTPQSSGEIEAIKRAVRKRDGMRCVSCGMTDAEHLKRYARTLDVHRLTPGSLYAVDETCQTLCRPCHGPQPRRKPGEPDLALGDRDSVMSFRPPDDLRQELETLARAERRSLAQMTLILLEEGLAARKAPSV
jgi:hypothetical protein